MTSSDLECATVMVRGGALKLLAAGMKETHPVIAKLADALNELEDARKAIVEYEFDEQLERLQTARKSLSEGIGAHTPSLLNPTPSAPVSSEGDSTPPEPQEAP